MSCYAHCMLIAGYDPAGWIQTGGPPLFFEAYITTVAVMTFMQERARHSYDVLIDLPVLGHKDVLYLVSEKWPPAPL